MWIKWVIEENNNSHCGWVNSVCTFSRTHGMKIHINRYNYSIAFSYIQTHTNKPPWKPVWHNCACVCACMCVCVIIKWLWQVVFVQAALSASVPHSDSLVEFLWDLMGRSGRGSQTSAVCESDRADNVDVWTELGGGGREARGGVLIQDPWPRCPWSDEAVKQRRRVEEARQHRASGSYQRFAAVASSFQVIWATLAELLKGQFTQIAKRFYLFYLL